MIIAKLHHKSRVIIVKKIEQAMKKRIFVTATNTDIGKTFTTIKLLEEFTRQGYKVGVIKPIETGVTTSPPDGTLLFNTVCKLNPSMQALTINDIVPIQFELPAAPYIANNANDINLSVIDTAIEKIEQYCDVLLIEGAGGALVPVDKEYMIIDFIDYFNAKALLVSHGDLGCINDTLQNINTLQQRNIDFEWVLNCKDFESFSLVSKPYFDDTFETYYILQHDLKALTKKLL